jgi:antirestriction protein ArdC
MQSQNELRQQITATLLDAIENKNLLPWRRPWRGLVIGRHRNIKGRAYSGVNPLLLEVHAATNGFQSETWGTYNQWSALGFQVQKRPSHVQPGEWGCTVVLYKPVKKTRIDEATGKEIESSFSLMRRFCVFNADQVAGPGIEKYRQPEQPTVPTTEFNFGPAEELIRATGARIFHGFGEAYYKRPWPEGSWPNHEEGDWIMLPPKEMFAMPGAYYETAFHELAHYSEVRLGWDRQKYGYSMGELVAEMAASMLSAELGVPQGENLENHASYLKHFLEGMRANQSYIFKASSQASRVVDYLLSFVRKEGEAPPEPEAVVEAVSQS